MPNQIAAGDDDDTLGKACRTNVQFPEDYDLLQFSGFTMAIAAFWRSTFRLAERHVGSIRQ